MKCSKKLTIAAFGAVIASVCLSASAFAADYNVWVNGVQVTDENAGDVLGEADGDGATVTYADGVLTLDGAEITLAQAGNAILASNDLTVILKGRNSITNGEIMSTLGSLVIEGNGSLEITADKTAIHGSTGLTFDGAVLDITANTPAYNAISSNGDIKVKDSELTIKGGGIGLNGQKGVTISSSKFNWTDGGDNSCSNFGIGAVDSLSIKNSKIELEGGYLGLVCNNGDIDIDNSRIEAITICTNDGNGIYSGGKVIISGGSEVNAESYYPAIFGTSGVEISGSRVDAVSTNDCAVYSPEDIDITDSVVKADAPEGIEGILTDGTASASSSWIESSGVDDVINAENSVVFKGNEGTASGNVVITEDREIEAGKTLTVPEGASVVIEKGVVLTNNGTIVNNGTITNHGKIKGDGKIKGNHVKSDDDNQKGGSSYSLEEGRTKKDNEKDDELVATPEKNGPFYDVSTNDPSYDAIINVYEKGWMEGVGEGVFAPNGTLTRGMAAQILWNMAGNPEPAQTAPFLDVTADAWYYRAVAWAYEQGIVLGYDKITFGPNDYVTTEQFTIMLEKSKGNIPAPYVGGAPNATRGWVAAEISR